MRIHVSRNEVFVEGEGMNIHMPYSTIKEIKNIDESQISLLRVVAFGIIGALWKKKREVSVYYL